MKEVCLILFQKKLDKKNILPSLEPFGFTVQHYDRIGAVLSVNELDLNEKTIGVLREEGIQIVDKALISMYINKKYYIHYVKGYWNET